jgi:hypothetical protein
LRGGSPPRGATVANAEAFALRTQSENALDRRQDARGPSDRLVDEAFGLHSALGRIRAFHLSATQEVLRRLEHHDKRSQDEVVSFDCR